MSTHFTLPSIYFGSDEETYDMVQATYKLNTDKFPSMNQFLQYVIVYGVVNDPTLKREKTDIPKTA